MLNSLAHRVARFLNFHKKNQSEAGVALQGKDPENISPAIGAGGDGKLAEFEQLCKKGGYGYFTYDEHGELTGTAFMPPEVYAKSSDKIR